MSDPVEPYVKTLEDELDWKLVDQLHGAVSQTSSYCFEIKKFCVTTLFVVIGIIIKFTKDNLDHSIFVTAILITVVFWFLDSVAYYYQVKLRGMMDRVRGSIFDRRKSKVIQTEPAKVIEPNRTNIKQSKLILNAAFNHSMWLYPILVIITLLLWASYFLGRIR
jgi:di/tricarboxylate transporter